MCWYACVGVQGGLCVYVQGRVHPVLDPGGVAGAVRPLPMTLLTYMVCRSECSAHRHVDMTWGDRRVDGSSSVFWGWPPCFLGLAHPRSTP